MRKNLITFMVCLIILMNVASADLIRGIDIDFVTIGNAGNPGDTRIDYPDSAEPYGCGAVDYIYKIGKFEITNGQWDAFVSAAGTPTGNPSTAYDESSHWTGTDVPTTMSWYEAAQFCNYLTSGDKSQGAYLFSGNNNNPGDFLGIDRDTAISAYDIIYVIPTEDEWYKAAYYTGSGYSTYANGTNDAPIEDVDSNFDYESGCQPWTVGTGTMEQNGTFDMMGNVYEWNEATYGGDRGHRGSSYNNNENYLRSSTRDNTYPYNEAPILGFRVASIPEPSTLLLLGLGAVMLRRKR